MTDCDVLVLADYFCDMVITGLPEPPRLGADLFGQAMEITPGGPYILATALQELMARMFWNHGSNHIDPPATAITIGTFVLNNINHVMK